MRAAAIALLLFACGDESANVNNRYSLALRWSFVDGRSCFDAGVVQLRVFDAGSRVVRATLPSCEAGRIGAPGAMPQDVGQVPGGERAYDLKALSASGGVLYQSRFTVDPAAQPELDVTLAFVGGA